jgi:hypothetical protein
MTMSSGSDEQRTRASVLAQSFRLVALPGESCDAIRRLLFGIIVPMECARRTGRSISLQVSEQRHRRFARNKADLWTFVARLTARNWVIGEYLLVIAPQIVFLHFETAAIADLD